MVALIGILNFSYEWEFEELSAFSCVIWGIKTHIDVFDYTNLFTFLSRMLFLDDCHLAFPIGALVQGY